MGTRDHAKPYRCPHCISSNVYFRLVEMETSDGEIRHEAELNCRACGQYEEFYRVDDPRVRLTDPDFYARHGAEYFELTKGWG